MNIEILDSQDKVITKVANSSNPNKDMTNYGGVSWRKYVESVQERINNIRRLKIEQIKSEGLVRIGAIVPALNTLTALDLIIELWPMLDITKAGIDIIKVRDIYVYVKNRISMAKSASEAQLNAYNPVTDPNWP